MKPPVGKVSIPSPEICRMESHNSLWPDNIDTAEELVIEQPCTASDMYYLIEDRRNIKTVKVCGQKYTCQEIRNMPIQDMLGGQRFTAQEIVATPFIDRTHPAPAGEIIWDEMPEAVEPAPQTTAPLIENPFIPDFEIWTQTTQAQQQVLQDVNPVRPTLAQLNAMRMAEATRQTTYITDEYQRAVEVMMRDNPNYRELGAITVADGYWSV